MYTETKTMIMAATVLMIIDYKWFAIITLIIALIFDKWQREFDEREE